MGNICIQVYVHLMMSDLFLGRYVPFLIYLPHPFLPTLHSISLLSVCDVIASHLLTGPCIFPSRAHSGFQSGASLSRPYCLSIFSLSSVSSSQTPVDGGQGYIHTLDFLSSFHLCPPKPRLHSSICQDCLLSCSG